MDAGSLQTAWRESVCRRRPELERVRAERLDALAADVEALIKGFDHQWQGQRTPRVEASLTAGRFRGGARPSHAELKPAPAPRGRGKGWTMDEAMQATRLRIYLGERDAWQGRGLAQALVRAARERGLAGATVLQGIEGYGAGSRIHVLHPFALSGDLPLMVEIIDHDERIQDFLPLVDAMLGGGLVTLDPVEVVSCRHRASKAQGSGTQGHPGGSPGTREGSGL